MYLLPQKSRSTHRRCSVKEGLQLQYCQVYKNTYFEKHLWAATSENEHVSDKFTEGRSFLNFLYPFKPFQKQPFRSVLSKRCSENMQQNYRRKPMLKCDFNKVLCNFLEITLQHGCSPVNLLHIFRTPFIRVPLNGCFCLLLS